MLTSHTSTCSRTCARDLQGPPPGVAGYITFSIVAGQAGDQLPAVWTPAGGSVRRVIVCSNSGQETSPPAVGTSQLV